MKLRHQIPAALFVASLSAVAFAAPYSNVLYSTDFETDVSGDFTTITSGAAPSPVVDYNFGFSGLDGRTGTGLYFQVKQTDGTGDGGTGEFGPAAVGAVLNPALIGGALTPDFRVNFDILTSSSTPGAGTTEFGYALVNSNTTDAFLGEGTAGTAFAKSTDGDSGRDYRVYLDGVEQTAAAINVPAGVNRLVWKAIELTVDADSVDVSIDGVPSITVPYSLTDAGTLQLGHFDTSNGSSIDASEQFIVFDNLVVSSAVIPEPASLGLLSLGSLALVRRRRA